ncbi:DUF5696 domain-containing protein [Lederbergia wuyishanensis]|uniref:Uncharacterized protein n=1 Tax=Lederbergia wuyishanensis TaxID=1347903 RepID=A0ABU0D987_9BACI|nr:DUF5696 domain-containing protein [Lederbergia wuyishanensis]MCJ8009414.1 DUF5696 domain-containing protein [Lederbergia wuyishanensis]MDQ0344977.1 hypothetical protein [Lederbergia wuyishanensis]
MKKRKKVILLLVLCFVLSLGSISAFANNDQSGKDSKNEKKVSESKTGSKSGSAFLNGLKNRGKTDDKSPSFLPQESDLQVVAENNDLILKADQKTGHFIVLNKKSGNEFRSFPNPDKWDINGTASVWISHLQSPFMFSYTEMNVRKDIVKESNFLQQEGTVDFKRIEDGFQITYEMPNIGFVIPIEVRLGKDFIETKVLAEGIIDEKAKDKKQLKDPLARLVSIRLFPFLGADTSEGENGFIFLPDGSGALVDFKKHRASTTNLYSERVYGDDVSFSTNFSTRLPVRMPIFGIKSGDQAILGVIREGDSYTNIVSAPSQSLSQYNWSTAEHLFRFKFYQTTDRKKSTGFYTYTKDIQRTDRVTRYYMIEKENLGYVDLAERYRQYLMEEQGIEKKEIDNENINLHLNILGGGTKTGFIFDSFLPLTTTEQATQIVEELKNQGVKGMSITYHGWQNKGYEKFGGHFPISKGLGGNDGMKKFIDFAHSNGYSVYFDASSYTFNNTGKDGFRPNRDGLRDLSSTVIASGKSKSDIVFVSPLFMEKVILKDLSKAKDLGVDGYLYGAGVGSMLATDYNDYHFAPRDVVKDSQQKILDATEKELGNVQVMAGNFYSLNNSNHMDMLDSDYSYDLFVDRKIPFAQIALHGLLSYTFNYGNMGGSITQNFLKGIEYGASPSFIVTYEESKKLLESKTLTGFYSTYYKDWESQIVNQYQRYNEALGSVQDQFITDHRQLASGVFETTYENGKRIIVNYNKNPFTHEGISIEAEDFVVLEGGK